MKPKVAFFSFTSCEGCQLQLLNCENELVALTEIVDIVSFREGMTEHSDDYQIAFVEGSIAREEEIPELHHIREQAEILITLGACAHLAGVNALKNLHPSLEEVRRAVYGEHWQTFDTIEARPLSAVVTVDHAIPGCPISPEEFLSCVTDLALGKKLRLPDYAVCVQCKLRENECLFDRGQFCLGPVVTAGCQAICPSFGSPCLGCRGLLAEPNLKAHHQVLHEHGLTVSDILAQFRLFNNLREAAC